MAGIENFMKLEKLSMAGIENFMKLEKLSIPEEWLSKNHKGKLWFKSFEDFEKTDMKKGLIILSSNNYQFYKICLRMENNKIQDYIVYPILKKRYWVVEVPSWR